MGTDITLSGVERSTLNRCEGVIHRGLKTFLEVGRALYEIREKRLYRETHSTFEQYCDSKWGISDRRARQLIDAASIVDELPAGDPTGTTVPVPGNERVARELGKVPPEEREIIWHDTVEEHGDTPTAPQVRATADRKRQGARQAPSEQAAVPSAPDADTDPYGDDNDAQAEPARVVHTSEADPPETGRTSPNRERLVEEFRKEIVRSFLLLDRFDALMGDDRFEYNKETLKENFMSDMKRLADKIDDVINALS